MDRSLGQRSKCLRHQETEKDLKQIPLFRPFTETMLAETFVLDSCASQAAGDDSKRQKEDLPRARHERQVRRDNELKSTRGEKRSLSRQTMSDRRIGQLQTTCTPAAVSAVFHYSRASAWLIGTRLTICSRLSPRDF